MIAGSPGWLMKELRTALRTSSARDRIHVTGFVAHEEKWALYKKSRLFLYPSFYEGFGFPPLEALLAGTPVVISHNSALPEVAGHWSTMINPYDVSELAAVTKELLDELPRVPESAQRAIEERFNWDKAGGQTIACLERAVL